MQATQSQTIVVERGFDVSRYREGSLEVAVSAITISGSAAVDVLAVQVMLVGVEPQTDFTGATMATVSLATATAGTMKATALTSNFGGRLQIQVKATQSTSAVTITCTITIQLTLKE